MSTPTFWVVESHLSGDLHYWSAGATGRGARDGWSRDIGWATRLHDRDSAEQVLFRLLGGLGRSAEHAMIQTAKVAPPAEQPSAHNPIHQGD